MFRKLKLSKSDKELYNFLKSTFDIKPKKMELYNLALTHSSYFRIHKVKKSTNERLEFLGDAILDSIVAAYLFEKHPNKSEGELTKLKSKVVSRKNLNYLALKANLQQYVKHGLNADTKETSVLGNALEAIIGAFYLDRGYKTCEEIVLKFLIKADIDQILYEQKDYKSLIHEWCQGNKKAVTFPVISENQEGGRFFYEVSAIVDNKICGKGIASSKKKAQQEAAREACLRLGIK